MTTATETRTLRGATFVAPAPSYTLFDTARGKCGVAWNERGITWIQLPEASEAATEKRLLAGERASATREDPPAWLRAAIAKIARQLSGKREDLSSIRLDTSGLAAFHRRVYEVAQKIEPGKTLTYGEIAAKLGAPRAARAVGQALARNPFPIVVPCHRVLAAGQKPGGFSAYGGWETKKALLAAEGVRLSSS
ncbi:methylated-DNA--[protein]-cysteine S-methyltransferase [bacterium]|nr:methylated-DNA--[protein]-cysteine S-methyltransferase [bacterium]